MHPVKILIRLRECAGVYVRKYVSDVVDQGPVVQSIVRGQNVKFSSKDNI